jgi:hypothetical protein
MKRIYVILIFVFFSGALVSSVAWFLYSREQGYENNEERYFELALQVKWNLLTIKALEEKDVEAAKKYQVEQIKTLIPILANYGNDSTRVYEDQIGEIIAMARQTTQAKQPKQPE